MHLLSANLLQDLFSLRTQDLCPLLDAEHYPPHTHLFKGTPHPTLPCPLLFSIGLRTSPTPSPCHRPWILWLTVYSPVFCLATSFFEICKPATLNLHSGFFIHVLDNHFFIHFYHVWYARLCVECYMRMYGTGGGSLHSGNRLLVLKEDDKWASKYPKQVVIMCWRE